MSRVMRLRRRRRVPGYCLARAGRRSRAVLRSRVLSIRRFLPSASSIRMSKRNSPGAGFARTIKITLLIDSDGKGKSVSNAEQAGVAVGRGGGRDEGVLNCVLFGGNRNSLVVRAALFRNSRCKFQSVFRRNVRNTDFHFFRGG